MNRELADHLNMYWDWGLSIVPVPHKQKGCLIPGWDKYRVERANRDQIRLWFSSGRPDLFGNVGLVTGYGHFVVLDFDRPGALWESLGGLANMRNLTPIVQSSPDRYHVYLRVVGEPPRDFRFDEGEVKGIGMVVAPPSVHPSGSKYRIINPEVTEILEVATLAEFGIYPSSGNGKKVPTAVPETIGEGARNDTLASIAGSLRSRGLDAETIYACLQVVNERKIMPPLDDGTIYTIANSIGRYSVSTENKVEPKKVAEWI